MPNAKKIRPAFKVGDKVVMLGTGEHTTIKFHMYEDEGEPLFDCYMVKDRTIHHASEMEKFKKGK